MESRTHEEIVGVGNIAANAEELHQVVELAMNITTYLFSGNGALISIHPSQCNLSLRERDVLLPALSR